MYSDIISQVRSSDELSVLQSEIEFLKEAIFSSKEPLEKILDSRVRTSFADIFKSRFAEGNPQKYLEGLEIEIQKLLEVKLVVAREPSSELLDTIFDWVSQNVGAGIIIKLEFDPSILGGAVISFNGKYYDGSLGKILNSALAENKSSIMEKIVNFK